MQKDKVRIYQLARELGMESKDLLELCQRNGMDLKNQLSGVDADQRIQIEQLVKGGGTTTATLAPPAPAPARPGPVPDTGRKVRDLGGVPRPVAPPPQPVVSVPAPAARPAPTPTPTPAAAEVPEVEPAKPAVEPRVEPTPTPAAEVEQPPVVVAETISASPVAEVQPIEPVQPAPAPEPVKPAAVVTPPTPAAEIKPVEPAKPAASAPSEPLEKPAPTAPPAPTPRPMPPMDHHPRPMVRDLHDRIGRITGRGTVRDLGKSGGGGKPSTPAAKGPGGGGPPIPTTAAPPPARTGMAQPPTPRAPSGAKGGPKPTTPAGPKMLSQFTPEQLEQMARPKADIKGILNAVPEPVVVAPTEVEEEEEAKKKDKKAPGKGASVGDRNQRRKLREERAQERKLRGVAVAAVGDLVLDDRGAGTVNKRRDRQQRKPVPAARIKKDRVTIEPPITIRVLSEALGKKAAELLFKLMGHGLKGININSTISAELAEELALEAGIELEIRKPLDAEEQVLDILNKPDTPEELLLRAPIVTIMGHVDHGKTSLLDRIRQEYGLKSNVVSTEAGGITQVLRAWRVEKDGKPITFLDTPGHEAFTKMRARGAQVTDIAVIVVAANDGVMPQTQEAISHAKAAKVSLIVAINKVDLPDANVEKTRRQLYNLEVLPDNMGGDTPFVETSASTGKGIDELLEQISLVAEFTKELKANPNKPAKGTCLEAMLTEGEGVRATLLVQAGTLRKGDIVLCGSSYGRVRQLYNDLGQPIESAGPSVPVRITGLDEVPNADDPFYVMPDLAQAQQIAEKRKSKQRILAAAPQRSAFDFSKLTEAKIAELKVILKADLRGSIEAIRKELEKLKHEEVAVRVLHAAVGGITESDVQLALTSPEDTMIVGFNAVPDERARALAEERNIPIREYDIIYNLTNDIKAALEGKLKPRQEVVHLGRAVVRETFKISRVGTIAGCYVTQGTIKRNARIRLIRDGVVIYPPPDRSASLDSLKRFKDDAAEVREGFECGMKIAGYDDVKEGDVIEAYRVEEVQRSLEG